MPYNKILIAVDNSEHSLIAAKKGIELAHHLKASVALLFVIDRTKIIHSSDTGIFAEEAAEQLRREADTTLDQVTTLFGSDDLTRLTPEGTPTEEIIKTAEGWDADLIVMGTHGRTGLLHLLLGSIAEHVLRHSKIPVLVVPSKNNRLHSS
jgi:nucleotide-binding universal stress UspA family protein